MRRRVAWALAAVLCQVGAVGAQVSDAVRSEGSAPGGALGAVQPLDAMVVASVAGGFAGSDPLSIDTDIDAIAALEQQAFREFRWDVLVPISVDLAFQTPVAEGVTAGLLLSDDGETFSMSQGSTTAQPGQVVAVIVVQRPVETDSSVTFLAAEWTFELTAAAVGQDQGVRTLGPVLLPIAVGDDLGCSDPGCGEPPVGTVAPVALTGQALAEALQSELARLGCYDIAVDGLWGPGSRRAVTAFNQATGLDLPVASATQEALNAATRQATQVCE